MPKLADLHNHALYGLDDGAADEACTLQMLDISYAQGVRAVCLTPHGDVMRFPYEKAKLLAHFEALSACCRERYPDLSLFLGNEIYGYIDSADALAAGCFFPLGHSRVALVEFDSDVDFRKMCNVLQSYHAHGFQPMLAHAERCLSLLDDEGRVRELVARRVRIQLNTSAFRRGLLPSRVNRFAYHMVEAGLVDVVATDAHGIASRTPHMLGAYQEVEKRYGSRVAEQLFYRNPLHILLGK